MMMEAVREALGRLLERIERPAILADPQGRIEAANEPWRRMSARLSPPTRERLPAEVSRRAGAMADGALGQPNAGRGGAPVELVVPVALVDGGDAPLRLEVHPIKPSRDEPAVGFVGIAIDGPGEPASSGVQAESERFLQEIVDCIPVGVAVYDPKERLLLANAAWRRARPKAAPHLSPGMTLEQVIRVGVATGQYLPSIPPNAPPERVAAYVDEVRACLRGRSAPAGDREMQLADGSWMLYHNQPTPSGHLVSTSSDVSEIKRQQMFLREVLDALPAGVLVVDPELRVVLWNKGYEDVVPGLAKHLRSGMPLAEAARIAVDEGDIAPDVPPDAPEEAKRQRVRFVLEHYRNPGRARRRELPDGRSVQVREQRSRSGHVVSAVTDISDLAAAMRNLEVARDEARAAAEAKSRFIARMGHELRTPLNAIIGFGELLEEDAGLGAEQRERVRLIAEAGRHLLDLINDLLDLSRIEAGRIDLVDRSFELPALLGSSLDLVRVQARRKRLELGVELAADLPREVRGDPTRLRQIVLNLLSNAVKFTPAGGRVVLRARRVEGAASPGGAVVVRIEVEDSGPGIPRERLGLLFREFERVTPSLEPGTGLGLAISARLAEVMGGRMDCDSEVGRGSLFRVELPFAVVGTPSAPAGAAVSRGTSAPAEPLRVLVVDDVAANRVLARTLLVSAGHRVELAADGEEAVAAVAAGGFDLVLMDVQMPGVDGLEATRRIRALPPPRGRVPIIALTAAALPEQVEECLRAGMDAHLAKPIGRDELLAAVAGFRCEPGGETEARLVEQALAELERELGEAIGSLLLNVVGEFRLAREWLAQAIAAGQVTSPLRQSLSRLSAGGRMVGADRLSAAAERLSAAADAGLESRQALEAALAALDNALPLLEARLAATGQAGAQARLA